jgi:phenylalanyl-tRNA synthetase beta chain
LTLTFASAADLDLMGHAEAVRVQNPPSADEPFLRRSLVPNLLEALEVTLRRGGPGASVFEVGHVFHPADPVDEREVVAVVMSGPAGTGPHAEPRALDFFDAKGVLESAMLTLGVERWDVGGPAGPPMHPGRSARVEIAGVEAGVVGELDPRVAQRRDLPSRVGILELDVAALVAAARTATSYRDIPRFPPVRRDLAFLVDAATPAGRVRSALEDAAGALLGSCTLFDVHTGPPLPAGTKSLAFSVDLRAADRTLTDAEASGAVEAIVARLAGDFGARLRSG